MEPNTTCKNCGKEICKTNFRLKKHAYHFCDINCMNDYHKKSPKILITNCDYCNKEITRTSNEQKRSKTGLFFCGNLCKNKYLVRNKRWRKDKVHSHRSRISILLEKANYSCQKCGYNEEKKMLDIHHYDHNHKNNKFENLRVLCVWCHLKHHRLKLEYDLPTIMNTEQIEFEINNFFEDRLKHKEKKVYEKKCKCCQKQFKTTNKKVIYCSNICADTGRRKVKERPDKEHLLKEIEETNFCAVGRKYGVSDNAIRKWLR